MLSTPVSLVHGNRVGQGRRLPDFRKNILPVCAGLLLYGVLITGIARGADWDFVPSVELEGSYNTNIRLTTAAHDAVWGSIFRPAVKLNSETRTWWVSGGVELRVNRYSGEDRLDSNDYLFDLLGQRETPWGQWRLDSAYHLDSTLQSELLDTGLVQVRKRRTERHLGPSWTGTLTPNTGLQVQYNYRDVSYAEALNTGLFDYRDQSVSAGIYYDLGKSSQAMLSAYYSRYEVTEIRFDSDYVALQGSLTAELRKGLHSSLAAGLRNVDSEQKRFVGPQLRTFSDSSQGFNIDGTLAQELAHVRWRLGMSRAVSPTGGGYLVQTDRITAWLGWEWAQNWRPSLAVAFYRNEGLGINPGNVDRDYYRIAPRLVWFLSPTWSIRANYHYERQKYDAATDAADRNRFELVVRYQGESTTGR